MERAKIRSNERQASLYRAGILEAYGQTGPDAIPGHHQLHAFGSLLKFHGKYFIRIVGFINRDLEFIQVPGRIDLEPPGIQIIIQYKPPLVLKGDAIENIASFGYLLVIDSNIFEEFDLSGFIGPQSPDRPIF